MEDIPPNIEYWRRRNIRSLFALKSNRLKKTFFNIISMIIRVSIQNRQWKWLPFPKSFASVCVCTQCAMNIFVICLLIYSIPYQNGLSLTVFMKIMEKRQLGITDFIVTQWQTIGSFVIIRMKPNTKNGIRIISRLNLNSNSP